MVMRWVRRQTWSQFGYVHFHWEAPMRFAVEDSSALVRSVVPNGQIIKGISLGRQGMRLRACNSGRGKGWQQETKVSACAVHRVVSIAGIEFPCQWRYHSSDSNFNSIALISF